MKTYDVPHQNASLSRGGTGEKVSGYTTNRNIQMLLALMLDYGVRRVVVSPGTTHFEIVAGMQYSGKFLMYSEVDERAAAYMAVGMAAESGEPVALVCTESVASRNYYPAITEAYYRHLPVLAITGVHSYSMIGNLHPQIIDRSVSPSDTFRIKVHLPELKDEEDVWESELLINKALLELRHRGGGPVHIDLPRTNERTAAVSFTAKELCVPRVIHRFTGDDVLPPISRRKTAVFVGTHAQFTREETNALDAFCAAHDGVAFCGQTSGYQGKYRVLANLAAAQHTDYDIFQGIDLLVHIGGAASDRTMGRLKNIREVWRVEPEGEVRDTFRRLTAVFEMEERTFFERYGAAEGGGSDSYLRQCLSVTRSLSVPLQRLPFSVIYVAGVISAHLPEGAILHLGCSHSLQAWSMFELPKGVTCSGNTGTRGIDGALSAFLGASLVDPARLAFCALGDLTFFYNMNALGNRDLGPNVRILVVNNNGGALMKTNVSVHPYMKDVEADLFLAAAGHFGGGAAPVVESYARSLGFEYLTASDKEEFETAYRRFVTPEVTGKPMLFEVFTKDVDERKAFDMMFNIDVSAQGVAKQMAKQILGPKGTHIVKKIIK